MAYKENSIIDYINGNDACLGAVVKDGESRLQLKNILVDNVKIPYRQIIIDHGIVDTDYKKALIKVQNAINEVKGEIDTPFIWEIFAENPGEHPLSEISEQYFGEATPVQLSALLRALWEDTLHFQKIQANGTHIKVRSSEEAQEIERLQKMRAERAQQREKAISWLAEAMGYKGEAPFPVPENYESLIANAIDYLMCGTNSEVVNLLSRLSDGKKARENAITLLKATQRMPEDADEFLLSNGIHAGFSKAVLEYVAQLPDTFDLSHRTTFEQEVLFSIDDAETMEIDDALSCRQEGDETIIGIYIADPACYVSKDDLLDEVAAERPLSLYLPTTTVKMFPDRLSCELASLKQDRLAPALAFTIRASQDGEVLDWSLAPAAVKVAHRLTYDEADAIMEGNTSEHPLANSLKNLGKIADAMRAFREEDGAIILNRPELRIRVRDGEVTVTAEDQETPSHRMVAELMVLANHLAAKYALHNDVPVIYRTQEAPSGPVTSVHKYEPYFFEQQVKKMKRTRLSTYPQPHFGLGLDLYIQISSPLRRYADLVMHRQLAAHCLGQPLPYTQEELFTVLDKVDSTATQNRFLEREADNTWLLEYLKRNLLGKTIGATVMRVEGRTILAELDFYCIRGILLCRERPMPGEHQKVTIKEVYPESGRLILQAN